MPSFSRAMSMIGRILADCAISMSERGFVCCEAVIEALAAAAAWVGVMRTSFQW